MPRSSRAALLFAAVIGALAPEARAQPSPDDLSSAAALLDAAREALAKGDHELSCRRSQESLRLAPGIDALDLVAGCHEREGHVARAWGELREAERLALAQMDRARAESLHARFVAAGRRVARLSITLGYAGALPTVTRDDRPVPPAMWGVAEVVDPGRHLVVLQWGNQDTKALVTSTFVVDLEPGQTRALVLPLPAPPSDGNLQRGVGYGAGLFGVAAIVSGILLRASAHTKHAEAVATCNAAPHPTTECTPASLNTAADADSFDSLGAFAIGGGIGALVGGIVLVVSAPSLPVAPRATASRGGLAIGGSF